MSNNVSSCQNWKNWWNNCTTIDKFSQKIDDLDKGLNYACELLQIYCHQDTLQSIIQIAQDSFELVATNNETSLVNVTQFATLCGDDIDSSVFQFFIFLCEYSTQYPHLIALNWSNVYAMKNTSRLSYFEPDTLILAACQCFILVGLVKGISTCCNKANDIATYNSNKFARYLRRCTRAIISVSYTTLHWFQTINDDENPKFSTIRFISVKDIQTILPREVFKAIDSIESTIAMGRFAQLEQHMSYLQIARMCIYCQILDVARIQTRFDEEHMTYVTELIQYLSNNIDIQCLLESDIFASLRWRLVIPQTVENEELYDCNAVQNGAAFLLWAVYAAKRRFKCFSNHQESLPCLSYVLSPLTRSAYLCCAAAQLRLDQIAPISQDEQSIHVGTTYMCLDLVFAAYNQQQGMELQPISLSTSFRLPAYTTFNSIGISFPAQSYKLIELVNDPSDEPEILRLARTLTEIALAAGNNELEKNDSVYALLQLLNLCQPPLRWWVVRHCLVGMQAAPLAAILMDYVRQQVIQSIQLAHGDDFLKENSFIPPIAQKYEIMMLPVTLETPLRMPQGRAWNRYIFASPWILVLIHDVVSRKNTCAAFSTQEPSTTKVSETQTSDATEMPQQIHTLCLEDIAEFHQAVCTLVQQIIQVLQLFPSDTIEPLTSLIAAVHEYFQSHEWRITYSEYLQNTCTTRSKKIQDDIALLSKPGKVYQSLDVPYYEGKLDSNDIKANRNAQIPICSVSTHTSRSLNVNSSQTGALRSLWLLGFTISQVQDALTQFLNAIQHE